jgi:hypothetical protein
LLLFAAISVLSCKNDKVKSNQDAKNNQTSSVFRVTAKVVIKGDDTFSLFYTEDGSTDFKIDPIWVAVKGSETEQNVVFSLPEDIIPTELRLDFGFKKNPQDITLRSLTLEYGKKKRVIAGVELGHFFRADESKCSFNSQTGVIAAVVKDGVRQYPSLYPQEANLKQEIEKLIK